MSHWRFVVAALRHEHRKRKERHARREALRRKNLAGTMPFAFAVGIVAITWNANEGVGVGVGQEEGRTTSYELCGPSKGVL